MCKPECNNDQSATINGSQTHSDNQSVISSVSQFVSQSHIGSLLTKQYTGRLGIFHPIHASISLLTLPSIRVDNPRSREVDHVDPLAMPR